VYGIGRDSLRAIEETVLERPAFEPLLEDFPRGAMLADLSGERDLLTSSILDHRRFRSPWQGAHQGPHGIFQELCVHETIVRLANPNV
jgi:hypothetical protein